MKAYVLSRQSVWTNNLGKFCLLLTIPNIKFQAWHWSFQMEEIGRSQKAHINDLREECASTCLKVLELRLKHGETDCIRQTNGNWKNRVLCARPCRIREKSICNPANIILTRTIQSRRFKRKLELHPWEEISAPGIANWKRKWSATRNK